MQLLSCGSGSKCEFENMVKDSKPCVVSPSQLAIRESVDSLCRDGADA